jgi:LysM repeat protein
LIGISCVGYGVYSWMRSRAEQAPVPHPNPIVKTPAPSVPSPTAKAVPPASPDQKTAVARTIADIGAAYMPVLKKSGDIPAVSHPLREAKGYLARNELDLAAAVAQEASIALKAFKKTGGTSAESYEVVKGDTLWRIARDHSPVHQGPGWVTIWKANKRTVKDFNRIEVGWNLTIPVKPAKYIEPFWRPRQIAILPARHRRTTPVLQAQGPGANARLHRQKTIIAQQKAPASLEVDLPVVLAWARQQKQAGPMTVARTAPRTPAIQLASFQQVRFSAPPFLEAPQYH